MFCYSKNNLGKMHTTKYYLMHDHNSKMKRIGHFFAGYLKYFGMKKFESPYSFSEEAIGIIVVNEDNLKVIIFIIFLITMNSIS